MPVLVQEILRHLMPRPGGIYLDGTIGACGYAKAILEASSPSGRLVGLDLDPDVVNLARSKLKEFGDRVTVTHAGFQNAQEILQSMGITGTDAAVLDLGLSSDQLEDGERGFSFMLSGPLDMRFDTSSGATLSEILAGMSTEKLAKILWDYGEERLSRRISAAILRARDKGELSTTEDLARLAVRIYGPRRSKIHPATRTFQALRIAVNRELENLDKALKDIPDMLKPGGRFCVLSYHSLEDRMVKQSFRTRSRERTDWEVVTPKPIRPSVEEVRRNPRARSARMRVLARLGDRSGCKTSEAFEGMSGETFCKKGLPGHSPHN